MLSGCFKEGCLGLEMGGGSPCELWASVLYGPKCVCLEGGASGWRGGRRRVRVKRERTPAGNGALLPAR
ncbi:hypothetical protein E2C01_041611 [Portunus trituberculatus]|uniref:Uncharacterized protein n=1 Tax=Portunus trituberculatus TaxID=210409 RepID=A0A5B7FN14_PORTR|nr:hypothetical protein [Portunus trituberculatus]